MIAHRRRRSVLVCKVLLQTTVLQGMETSESSKRNDGGVDCKHKVFLCHSGEQKDFAEWMYDEIRSHDRSAFLDKSRDSLPLGCDFPKEIFKAIEECEVGVVVLSKVFFTKTWWPMVEFARLAKRKEENKEFCMILVLYDIELVECCNTKKQTEWIDHWKVWALSDERIVIEDWTSVFKLFGPILSISCDKVGGAKPVIREVVAEVCKCVMPETRGDDSDMQGRERICKFVWAERCASEVSRVHGARVVGVYGMGGIGKSTMCRALCEKLRSEFGNKVCHVELATNRDDGQEKEMLEEMVKSLIGTRHEVVGGCNRTKLLNLLMDKLQNQKVFLAVDNVGDGASTKEQARALLKSRFAKDSFVVVTARSMEMLRDVGISEGDCHEMPELDDKEAKRLFLNNAPEDLDPEDALVEERVRMCYFSKGDGKGCHYHPLALKVLGGQLGYNRGDWRPRLEGRDRFNALREKEHPIFSILRSSFDSLKAEDQLLFVDAALFFPKIYSNGLNFSLDVNIMTWLGTIHGRNEAELILRLKVLKRKSLIEDIGDGTSKVGMHDLWREFCVTEITRGDVKDRFWFYRMDKMHKTMEEHDFYSGGWKNLQRVCLTSRMWRWKNEIMKVREMDFQHCANLTVLKLVYVDVENGVVDVTNLVKLKSLEVQSLRPQTPIDIEGLGSLRDLCVLVWLDTPKKSTSIAEIAGLVHLQVLVFSVEDASYFELCQPGLYTVSMDKPQIAKIPNLEELCRLKVVRLRLGSLPMHLEWSSMANLQHLNLSNNGKLRSCGGLEDLVVLVELKLDRCYDLEELPFLGKLTKLEKLDISYCKVSAVLGLECLVALQEFSATCCKRLKVLPNMQKLSNLEVLDLGESLVERVLGLKGLTALQRLSVDFDMVKDYLSQPQLTKMQIMKIGSWGKEGLPCMVDWTGLEQLEISNCHGVRKLEGLKSLSSLQNLGIQYCDFQDVSIVSYLTSLQSLEIWECKKLEKVPCLDRLLKLESLKLRTLGSTFWEGSRIVPHLWYLKVDDMPIRCFPNLSNFPQLRGLSISRCHSLIGVTYDGPLAMLENIFIENCSSLEFLPRFEECMRLRDLTIRGCHSLKATPDSYDLRPYEITDYEEDME